jgi:hypothetical protein
MVRGQDGDSLEVRRRCAHRIVTRGIGHNLLQEAPRAFADADINVAGF